MTEVLAVIGTVLMMCGAVIVVTQAIRGTTGLRRLRTEGPETQRAVRRAIHDGGTEDPHIDRLARETFRRTTLPGWAKPFFVVLIVVAVAGLILGPHSFPRAAINVAQMIGGAGLLMQAVIGQRQRDAYRGLS